MPFRRLARSTKVGFKNFFSFDNSRKKMCDRLAAIADADGPVTKGKTVALLGLYVAYKGSPIALVANIVKSSEEAANSYMHQNAVNLAEENAKDDVRGLLVHTGMSAGAVERVMKMVENGAYDSKEVAYMSPADLHAFNELVYELHSKADAWGEGGMVSF